MKDPVASPTACEASSGADCSALPVGYLGRCNCPDCASNNCPERHNTRLHGYAVALMGLMDAVENDGADLDEVLFLAQTWREQEAIKREQNPAIQTRRDD